MHKSILLSTVLALGCATADDVKKLEEKVDALTKKVETLDKAPKAAAATGGAENKEAETAAQEMLKEIQTLMGNNDIDGAKKKLGELEKKYASTRTFRRAQKLSKEGISAEVIDLRTLVPPDLDAVEQSVRKTGRLIVAAEDRSFAGFVRSIQGAMVERIPSLPTRALGQKNIPGIAQSLVLEHATVLAEIDIIEASRDLCAQTVSHGQGGWSWIPPRYFIS